jgi:hypothetical protein
VQQASRIAVRTISEQVPRLNLDEVRLVLFSQADFELYSKAATES